MLLVKYYGKVFVVIVAYNGKYWYDRCLKSLQNSVLPLHIIVIDNDSADDTLDYLKIFYPDIHLIESKSNLGFGKANNLGLRFAIDHGADYVFLLNQDAWIEPNTISELIRIHIENIEYGILSPMHLNAGKTAIENGLMHYIADYDKTSTDLINDLYFKNCKNVYEVKYINAAAWLLPRTTLDNIGGFDPIFYHYGEDDNYIQRVLYHGFKIGICPEITVCHDTERTVSKNSKSMQSRYKNLLVELTDINRNDSLTLSVLFDLKKAILKILKLNFISTKIYLSNGVYKLRMKKKIKKSIVQNKKLTASWL